jgi:hypothetical protein
MQQILNYGQPLEAPPTFEQPTYTQPPQPPQYHGTGAVLSLSQEEINLINRHRQGQVSNAPTYTTDPTAYQNTNPAPTNTGSRFNPIDVLLRKNPVLAIADTVIRMVVPKGYGSYVTAAGIVGISVAAYFGVQVPFFEIPQEMAGASGLAGIGLWFLRNAQN